MPIENEQRGESDRIIGYLQGGFEGMQDTLKRVLENQATHSEADKVQFGQIFEGLGGLRDRVVRIEGVADAVESHSDAILTIEKRLNERDDLEKAHQAIRKNNIRWSRAIIGFAAFVGTMAGAAGANIKSFFKWVLTVVK